MLDGKEGKPVFFIARRTEIKETGKAGMKRIQRSLKALTFKAQRGFGAETFLLLR
jgi:hypothetical protein